MSKITTLSRTQKIIVNPATSSVSVINAGPPGPGVSGSSDARILELLDLALQEGSGIDIDRTTPGVFNIINTGAVSEYGSENARDDIAAALHGVADRILITPDDNGNIINIDLDPVVMDRFLALEQAKSLIQYKDSTVASGASYMNLTGSAGWVSAANNAAFNVAGDMTVIARVKMPSTATAFSIGGRWGASTALGQWRWSITTTGQIGVTITVNGTSTDLVTTTAVSPLVFNGAWIWIRQTRTSSDGFIDFYTGADDGTNTPPATWTSFQANRTADAGVLWNNSGALSVPMSIGSYNAGAGASPFTGQIGRMIVYSGTSPASTVVADGNASDWVSGTTWTGPASNTWTLNGTATIVTGGTNAVSNTAAEFTLAETDAFVGISLKRGDTLMWSAAGCFINTSAAAVNFTPKLQINGVNLFTMPAISIPNTAAGQTYRWEAATKCEVNAPDGTKQIAQARFKVFSAVTGTDLGSSVMSAALSGGDFGGVRAEAITTFVTIPVIRLRNTMASAAATISSRPSLTQLFLSVS